MVDRQLIFSDRHYGLAIDWDHDVSPIWKKAEPSKCRCGKAACENCGVAFHSWFTEQLQSVFASEIDNLCYVMFRFYMVKFGPRQLQVLDIPKLSSVALQVIGGAGSEAQKWLGVVDVVTTDSSSRDNPDCVMYVWLATTLMTPEQLQHMKKEARGFENMLYNLLVPLQNSGVAATGEVDSSFVVPHDYARWLQGVRGKEYGSERLREKERGRFLGNAMHSDRLVMVNLQRDGDRIFAKHH